MEISPFVRKGLGKCQSTRFFRSCDFWISPYFACAPFGTLVDFYLFKVFSSSTMELVCTENAHSEPLVYSRTVASTALPAGRSTCIFQGQETLRFDGACLEFPSRWDLNSVSETAKELLNTCQTNAKYHMPNTKCQIANTLTNAKYHGNTKQLPNGLSISRMPTDIHG